jgi:alpha-glucosidase
LLVLLHGAANAVDLHDQHALEQGKILATTLLATHGPVALEYGQEIGLSMPKDGGGSRVMQWTPSNITPPQTQASPAPIERVHAAPSASRADVYGPYVPYVAPEDRPSPPPAAKPDMNTLPGFTTGKLPLNADAGASTWNMAAEDADPNSLLNFYRKLSQLHHDNPAFREGSGYTLNDDAEGVLLWVLTAPATARSGATVIAACNLTGKRVAVPLRSDFGRRSLRVGELRPLITSAAVNAQADQTTQAILLAPWSVFVGELER